MKKLICLVICIACVLTMLASCGDDTVCEAHADADKNGACDTCGIPVYTVVEKVPTEETVVDMIVSAIPENATLGTIWTFAEDGAPLAAFTKADKLENLNNAPEYSMFLDYGNTLLAYRYTTQTAGADTTIETNPDDYFADDKFTDTYVIYNILKDVNVCTYTTGEYTLEDKSLSHVDTVMPSLVEGFFIKAEITDRYFELYDENNPDDGYWASSRYVAYYLADGSKVFDARDYIDEGYWDEPTDFEIDAEYAYVTIDNVKYAYDLETCALLTQGDKDSFVYRPAFDYETDAYGYVETDDKIYVYDLSKWVECVYSYEFPYNASVWYLANDNILVQKRVTLPDGAVNYDYTDGDNKYDLVYTIVDVAAKTATEVEFGYYIDDVYVPDEDEGYSAAVKNLLIVFEIKDKNLGKTLYLACDGALAILAERDLALPEFVSDIYAVADGVFRGTVVYGDGSEVDKLFDANGAELATLPNGANVRSTYVECNGKYYDFTMKLIFDPAADEDALYTKYAEGDGFLLFGKGDDYYYWNASLAAPVLVVDDTNVVEAEPGAEPIPAPNPVVEQRFVGTAWEYFIVETKTTTAAAVAGDPDVVTYEYKVYNSANQCILTTATEVNVNIGEDYIVATDDEGNIYFIR